MLRLLSRGILLLWLGILFILSVVYGIGQQQGTSYSFKFWLAGLSSDRQIVYDIETGLATVNNEIPRTAFRVQASPSGEHFYMLDFCPNSDSFCIIFDNQYLYEIGEDLSFIDFLFFWLNDSQVLRLRQQDLIVEVYLLDLEAGEEELLASHEGSGTLASLSPNLQYLLLPHPIFGSVLDIEAREWRDLYFADEFYWSPNSRYLAAYQTPPIEFGQTPELFLTILDLETGEEIRIAEEDLAGNFVTVKPPIWSGDSAAIAFNLDGEGSGDTAIYAYSIEEREIRLLYDAEARHPRAWSPDGNSLLMEVTIGRRAPLEILNLQTGDVHLLDIENTRVQNNQITWSPDGRYLVLDYVPQGLRGLRRMAVYEASTGRLYSVRDFELHDYSPLLENYSNFEWLE